jgi:carboxylate-amine ligase
VNELQAARSNLILECIVTWESKIEIGKLMNQAFFAIYLRFPLTPLLGRQTYRLNPRTKVFDKFPRTGLPEYFESVASYDNFLETLVNTNCIDNQKKIWWDLRIPLIPLNSAFAT